MFAITSMNSIPRFVIALSLFAGALGFSGCIAAIGNREPIQSRARVGTTLGQELLDLQKARDAGALTEAEYQAQRAKLLGNQPGA